MTLTDMQNALKKLQLEQYAFASAMGCMSFDAATVAPCASAAGRGEAMAVLSEKSYELLVSDETRALLDGLWAQRDELDAATRRQVELLKKDLEDMTRIPVEEYAAYSRILSQSAEMWRQAKASNDYALFEPLLNQVIDYSRRFAAYTDPDRAPYDVLLDTYEKGMDMATLDPFFAMLRSRIVPLMEKVQNRPAAPAFASAACPVPAQRELAHYLMDVMGLDKTRCILAETEHPFTTGSNKCDVRITTHYHENMFLSSMYSVIHESGHALYEMGIDDACQFTCLADGASMGMHESQSRFFENLVGHSEGFLRFLSPKLHELFPDALRGVSDEQLIRGANRVEPSLVRTEADQVTYPLHIMIRYELEKQLIGGTLSTKDLPEAWNAMYRDYLGITVPSDSMGVLQDMHWSDGMFGYFPTYALGSAYASQFLHAMKQTVDVDALIAKGELAPITAWLHENVHRHGKLYTPAQLLEKATGEAFNPNYYVEHLVKCV